MNHRPGWVCGRARWDPLWQVATAQSNWGIPENNLFACFDQFVFSILESVNETIWQHWTIMMIILTIMIMDFDYIWITSLNPMQIKVFSALAFDFNQLVYAVCGRPAPPRPADLDPFRAPYRPFWPCPLKKTFLVHLVIWTNSKRKHFFSGNRPLWDIHTDMLLNPAYEGNATDLGLHGKSSTFELSNHGNQYCLPTRNQLLLTCMCDLCSALCQYV